MVYEFIHEAFDMPPPLSLNSDDDTFSSTYQRHQSCHLIKPFLIFHFSGFSLLRPPFFSARPQILFPCIVASPQFSSSLFFLSTTRNCISFCKLCWLMTTSCLYERPELVVINLHVTRSGILPDPPLCHQ